MTKRILLVDHDQENVRRTLGALADAGFEIDVAGNSDTAFELLDKGPQLVLIEADLPGTAGWEVCRRIKDSDGGGERPVVILHQPEADAELMAAVAQSGCDQLFDRSAPPEELAVLCGGLISAAASGPTSGGGRTASAPKAAPTQKKKRKRGKKARKAAKPSTVEKTPDRESLQYKVPTEAHTETALTAEEVGDAMGRLGRIIDSKAGESEHGAKAELGDFSRLEAEARNRRPQQSVASVGSTPRKVDGPRASSASGGPFGGPPADQGGDISDHLDKLFSGEKSPSATSGTGRPQKPAAPERPAGTHAGGAAPASPGPPAVAAKPPIGPPDPRKIDQPERDEPAKPEPVAVKSAPTPTRPHRDRSVGAITGPIGRSEDQTERITAPRHDRRQSDRRPPERPNVPPAARVALPKNIPREQIGKTAALPPKVEEPPNRLGLIAACVFVLVLAAALFFLRPGPSGEASTGETTVAEARDGETVPTTRSLPPLGAPETSGAENPDAVRLPETAAEEIAPSGSAGVRDAGTAVETGTPATATAPPPTPARPVKSETPPAPEPEASPPSSPAPTRATEAPTVVAPPGSTSKESASTNSASVAPAGGLTAGSETTGMVADTAPPEPKLAPAEPVPAVPATTATDTGTEQRPRDAPAEPPAAPVEESTEPQTVAEPEPPAAAVPESTPPVVIERVEAAYPAKARKRGERGTIVLKVLVNEQGRIVRVVVDQGMPGSELEAAAMSAVLRWRFKPALENGSPVRAWTEAYFDFE